MKTYWDFTEQERSLMTREEVEGLLDVELMTKGVKKIIAPILKPIKSVEVIKEIWFEVDGIYFKTAEQCQKCIALSPHKSSYEYSCGYDYHYAEPIKGKIEQKELYQHQDLLNLSAILKENKSAKEYNDNATNEYDKVKKEQDKILNGVWDNWYNCQELRNKYKKIQDTYYEYLKMTDDDEKMAISFLLKIYSQKEIDEGKKWI